MSGARRGADGPPRLLCIDKPAGLTSFAVVRVVRGITGYRRVGHGGTLDPFATGLLVTGLGAATRLMRFFGDGSKVYEAELAFGHETDTEDLTGEPLRRADHIPDEASIRAALAAFTGRILQVPPRISALHVDGERSYRRAWRGESFELPPREVEVHALELLQYAAPRAWLRVRCAGGTYIRALARDLGRHLESAAHLVALRRTDTGPFGLGQATPLADLAARWEAGERGMDPAALVAGWAQLALDPALAKRVRQGAQPDPGWWGLTGWETLPARVALMDECGALVAIAMREGPPPLRLAVVLPEVR